MTFKMKKWCVYWCFGYTINFNIEKRFWYLYSWEVNFGNITIITIDWEWLTIITHSSKQCWEFELWYDIQLLTSAAPQKHL